MLHLEAELTDPPAQRRDPSPVRVTLVNDGPESVLVNRRLAPGYAGSLSREVYAELTTADGAPAAHADLDYERPEPTDEDFVELGAGQSVSGEFDLFHWYRPREPGSYRVVLVYADERGEQRSPPLELEVA
ncbi:MAG: hypothetical protein QOJ46_1988 [bacterium]